VRYTYVVSGERNQPRRTGADMTAAYHIVRVPSAAPRYVVARQDPTDPRRWFAPAGSLGTATGRLEDLPTLAGVRVFRGPKAAQAWLDGQA
jgi:hypothetical protein